MRAKHFISEIDRRGFLKGLGAAAATAAVPSLAQAKDVIKFNPQDPEDLKLLKYVKAYWKKSLKVPKEVPPFNHVVFKVRFNGKGEILSVTLEGTTGNQDLDNAVKDSVKDIPDIVVMNSELKPEEVTFIRLSTKGYLPEPAISNTSDKNPDKETNISAGKELYQGIKVGTPIKTLEQKSEFKPNPKKAWALNFAGIDEFAKRAKLESEIQGPYNSKSYLTILSNEKGLVDGIVVSTLHSDLPPDWMEDHGIGMIGFDKSQFLTFLKRVFNKIPKEFGSRIGNPEATEDGGLGLAGGFGLGSALGKHGSVGVGIGFAKHGHAVIQQKLNNGSGLDTRMIIFTGTMSHHLTGVSAVRPQIHFLIQDPSAQTDLQINVKR